MSAGSVPREFAAWVAGHEGTEVETRATLSDAVKTEFVRSRRPRPFANQSCQTKQRSTRNWSPSHHFGEIVSVREDETSAELTALEKKGLDRKTNQSRRRKCSF